MEVKITFEAILITFRGIKSAIKTTTHDKKERTALIGEIKGAQARKARRRAGAYQWWARRVSMMGKVHKREGAQGVQFSTLA